jgi:predicted outer membrane repeat protein
MWVDDSGVTLSDVVFADNSASDDGGGLYCSGPGARIVDLLDVSFTGNAAGDDGGGMYAPDHSVTMMNVMFQDNTAGAWGGGLAVGDTGSELNADLTNVVVIGNSADEGGGLACLSGTLNLTNATFNANSAVSAGGAVYADEVNGTVTITNVIMWGDNSAYQPEIITDGLPSISYSLIQGTGGSGPGWDGEWGVDGGNNIDADPIFVDAVGANLRLLPSSPAIDAGDDSVPNLPATDFDDNPRIQNGAVDMGAYEFAAFTHASVNSIEDVPDDQGGWARIFFTRSSYDDPDETQYPIDRYDIHRRMDSPVLMATILSEGDPVEPGSEISVQTKDGFPVVLYAFAEGPRLIRFDDRYFVAPNDGGFGAPPGVWEVVGNVSAQQQDQYVRLVPTLGDSSAAGVPHTAYYISAHTTTPTVFYDSPVDSGYSVDNIAPGVPQGLSVAYNTGSGNQLSWEPSSEPDFQYCKIYRGSDPSFTTGPGNLVHETATPPWSDPDHDGGGIHYKITAVDHSGNESDPASPGTLTSAGDLPVPESFALHQNTPNPFNPTTVIRYDVPAGGGRVTLRIYDVAGRLIRTLVDRNVTPGHKSVTWDGKDARGNQVSSGIYFYRLVAGNATFTKKMVFLK